MLTSADSGNGAAASENFAVFLTQMQVSFVTLRPCELGRLTQSRVLNRACFFVHPAFQIFHARVRDGPSAHCVNLHQVMNRPTIPSTLVEQSTRRLRNGQRMTHAFEIRHCPLDNVIGKRHELGVVARSQLHDLHSQFQSTALLDLQDSPSPPTHRQSTDMH